MSSRVSCATVVRPFEYLMGRPQAAVGFLLMGLLLSGTGYGQTSRLKKMQEAAAAANAAQANSNTASSASQASSAAPNADSPIAGVAEETLPEPPVISWDGKDLTVDAENATLSSVLLGIRSQTGTSVEMPPSAGSERVAVHLGPAPIREVLASLLYGTDFNYVIQSSDQDENAVDKVILSAKDSDPTDESSSTTTTATADRRVRLMPGYAAPGKRDFEVAHQKEVEESAQSDDSATAGLTISQDPGATPDPPADNTRADSSNGTPASTDSANASSSTPDFGVQVAAQTQTATGNSSTSPLGGGDSALSKMEQDLQHMYQQRQQIQAQQNHPQAQGATN